MTNTFDEVALDVVPMAILRLDRAERVVFANKTAKALFGENVQGRPISAVLRHPDFHQALSETMVSGRNGQVKLTAATKSGTSQLEAFLTPSMAGQAGGALIAFDDQTALEHASAIRRDFVANVSHELRTPLTALVSFIETLGGAAQDDPVARGRFLGIMEREAGRMIRLVNDLLSLSRVEASEHRRPSEILDIVALLRSVIATHLEQADTLGVTINLEATEREIFVRGDSDQLMQVFHNLAENGLKYGGGGGKALHVIVSRVAREPKLGGPAVMVEVKDEGEGIDPIHLPRLTERFYRVDAHRSRETGGTGLGLAIVKHIINRHRGRLKIDSEPQKGSVFCVILPDF
ncbi:MAG: ATP-binding protein [Albidovulum sp.]